jgi:hypothetical protein
VQFVEPAGYERLAEKIDSMCNEWSVPCDNGHYYLAVPPDETAKDLDDLLASECSASAHTGPPVRGTVRERKYHEHDKGERLVSSRA